MSWRCINYLTRLRRELPRGALLQPDLVLGDDGRLRVHPDKVAPDGAAGVGEHEVDAGVRSHGGEVPLEKE